MRRILTLLCIVVALGCDDDDGPSGPVLSSDAVVGVYDLDVFTFDPQGSLPAIDLRGRLSASLIPQLIVARDSFQLVYRDPETGLVRTPSGTYTLTRTGIQLNFRTMAEAQELLLPQRPSFTFEEGEERSLSFDQSVGVPLARYRTLAPEHADEPLANPVPGALRLRFVTET